MVPIRFSIESWRVSVQKQGMGTVVSTPALIDCGNQCIAMFPRDLMTVQLTATPSVSTRFTGWSGHCYGTDPVCQILLFVDEQVGATFVTNPAVRVVLGGNGTGQVSSTPPGITCGTMCVGYFAPGTKVTLTPSANRGSTFTGWSGDCSGTNACVVTMDDAKAQSVVGATFTLTGS